MTGKVTVTMVFEVDKLVFKRYNPLTTETPFGIAHTISIGDIIAEADELREKLALTQGQSK